MQARLDTLTGKCWLYVLLLLLFLIPPYASRYYDPGQQTELIGQVLSAPLINAFAL